MQYRKSSGRMTSGRPKRTARNPAMAQPSTKLLRLLLLDVCGNTAVRVEGGFCSAGRQNLVLRPEETCFQAPSVLALTHKIR